MGTTRAPAVAGMFYPADPAELQRTVRSLLDDVTPSGRPPKAIIAPHAGYIYSGPTAAEVYARLAPLRRSVERVVLVGPSHRVGFQGLAVPSASHFQTPLGSVAIDVERRDRLLELPQVIELDQAHAQEHSLEVHLPFLQTVLAEFRLLPVVVGRVTDEQVAEVLQRVWGGPETLVVVSSDLSHYHDYVTARNMDRATSEAIVTLRPEAISEEGACGRLPIAGLLAVAQRLGLRAELVDLRSSGDTAGPRDRVVGYGAYAFTEPD